MREEIGSSLTSSCYGWQKDLSPSGQQKLKGVFPPHSLFYILSNMRVKLLYKINIIPVMHNHHITPGTSEKMIH